MNEKHNDLEHASLAHSFPLKCVGFTTSKSQLELIDTRPASLFCNELKVICYVQMSKATFLTYEFSSFTYSIVCIFVLKKET